MSSHDVSIRIEPTSSHVNSNVSIPIHSFTMETHACSIQQNMGKLKLPPYVYKKILCVGLLLAGYYLVSAILSSVKVKVNGTGNIRVHFKII